MAMLSVGDCIAIAKLVKDAACSLSKTKSAATDYQSLICDVDVLTTLLRAIDDGEIEIPPSRFNTIRRTIDDCRMALARYNVKLEKYKHSLGAISPKHGIVDVLRKLRWGFLSQRMVQELRHTVVQKTGILNVELGLENW